jgi:NitT/TauT family transport system ATP-binding protein
MTTPDTAACSLQPWNTADGSLPLIVNFQGVTKTYNAGEPKEFTAIKDISFEVEDLPNVGEFISVLGPSGCGKSTILRLIAGLAPHWPASVGKVEFQGKPVTGPGPDRGMVFQDYSNFPHLTVVDNIAFGLECAGVAKADRRAQAKEWMTRVGLDPEKDGNKYQHQLSGGMNQRVAIARTLILKPKLIIMDEPFGALDPTTRQRMQDLLLGLWKDLEATVFFVTHDVEEAVYLGDRVMILSPSPGTIRHKYMIHKAAPASAELTETTEFNDCVKTLRQHLKALEKER